MKSLLELEELMYPIMQNIKKAHVVQSHICSNLFDEYIDFEGTDTISVGLLLHNVKSYATYGDIVLDYILELEEQVNVLDSLVSTILKERSVTV